MERGGVRVLWIQAIVLGVAGVALFALPTEAARAWPWVLPPLAARFVGGALLGIGAAAATTAIRHIPRGLPALAVMGLGTLLAPLAGILTSGVEVSTPRLAAMTALVGALALVDVGLVRASHAGDVWGPLSRPFAAFFAIHLALVLPVGLAMYVAPTAVVDLWPWQLSIVNVRLVGAIFLASAPLSAMALRDRDWAAVYPTAIAYAVFATLALVATALHFGLFDAGRLRTWVFVGLYALAAIGSAMAVVRSSRARAGARSPGA